MKNAAGMTKQSLLSGRRSPFQEQAHCLVHYWHALMREREERAELSTQHYVSAYRIAAVYAALGDRDRAFKWLEHAYESRDGWLIWLVVDPVVDSLRSDERFTDLLRRMGLPTVTEPHKRESASHLIQAGPQPRKSFVGRFG